MFVTCQAGPLWSTSQTPGAHNRFLFIELTPRGSSSITWTVSAKVLETSIIEKKSLKGILRNWFRSAESLIKPAAVEAVVCVVASAFEAITSNIMFGNIKNVI
jgi:hypothetical protein